LSMPCEALSREYSTSILCLLHTAKTFDLVWIWLGGDYGNVFLMGFDGIQWEEKGEHNTNFHPMVDFLEASPLRRNLKLRDEEGISSLPDAELFENLTLMGYNISPNQKFTFQMGQGEGSGTPTEPHYTPSLEAQTPSHTTHPTSSLLPVTTTSIPTVTLTKTTPIRHYTRRTRIAQSSVPLTVADEPASPLRDVSQGEACHTDSGFITDQDKATIAKSSTLPHDSAPRVTSPAAVKGSMQHTIPELMALCTSMQRQLSELTDKFQAQEVEINRLKERVKLLEKREGAAATNSRDDTPIKGRSMDEREAVTERVSDDTEEMATVLTSMDASTVLASGVVYVPTGSGSIPTANTLAVRSVPTGSKEVPTASPVFATATVVTPYRRRKGKEVMIARDAEIARIHAEEELQSMIDGLDSNNETVAKYLEEYHQFSSELPMERRIELISDLEEAERIKRKGINLEQESEKKQKSSEEITEEAKSPEEVTEENIKEMMFIQRVRGVTRRSLDWEAAQHVIIDWKLYDSCGVHHVAAKDKEIFMLVEKDYPMRKGLALVMICYKLQVENFSQMANDLVLKIFKIANSPRLQIII
nr:hypothetical protein [Tanacetum cinerariifolium]